MSETTNSDGTSFGASTEFLSAILEAVGPGEMYATDHGVTSLVSIDGQADSIAIDAEMLDALAALRPFEKDGVFYRPYGDGRNPLLVVGRKDSPPEPRVPASLLAGEFLKMGLARYERLESRRRRKEMSTAAQIQWEQLSTHAIRGGGHDAAGALAPAYEVAGDMFDLALDTEDRLVAISMDAMGHGLSAALSASIAIGAVRNARRSGRSLNEQAQAAHDALNRQFGGDRFVTMTALQFDNDRIRVINAGHEPMKLCTADGTQTLDIPADSPLGVGPTSNYFTHEMPLLEDGEMLCLTSDGAASATDEDGGIFGQDAVDDVLVRHRDQLPLAVANHVTRAVLAHSADRVSDDITAVVIQPVRQ